MKFQFLYLLTGFTETPKREQLESLGLSHLAGASLTPCSVASGPDECGGGLIVCVDGDQRIGFYPSEQTWRRLNDRLFVGWQQLPSPSDLQRRETIAGHEIELGDGRRWIAPKARAWSTERSGELVSGESLPCRLTLNDSGTWSRGAALPQYAELEAIASGWFDQRFANDVQEKADGGAVQQFSFADAPTKATQCLAANYRICPIEADILGLWTSATVIQVLDAAIDYPSLLEIVKKKMVSAP